MDRMLNVVVILLLGSLVSTHGPHIGGIIATTLLCGRTMSSIRRRAFYVEG
jgi:hypothetical protein